jgi:hypothetical protein
MTKNVGSIDRIVRIVLGLVLLAIAFFAGFTTWTTIGAIAGVVFIATAGMKFCPMYRIFGIQTCKM